ncbi:MAG: hypothetical protein Q9191_008035, partial [Dirinaria sp. TL-2023a]
TTEYVIAFMYFTRADDKRNRVRVMIRRELHVVDDLKVNVLIDNDIMSAEDISIDLEKRVARIDSCGVIVSIEIRTSHKSSSVQKSVHLRKTTVISPRSEQTVEIHNLAVSDDRDYLFESAELNHLIIYAHMINATTRAVILKNDFNSSIQVSRNHRLGRIIELEFSNAYHVENQSIRDLATRRSRSDHKPF